MSPSWIRSVPAAAALAVAALALVAWSPVGAQQPGKIKGKTPDNFSYELRNGRRVPKAKRVTAADGSWKEEVRSGDCVTVRERTAAGEYREVRQCD